MGCRMKSLRTFIALELPQNVLSFLESLQSNLRQDGVDIRWVPPQNIHLTLKFLGDIPIEICPEIEAVLDEAGQGTAPMDLCVKGLGVFPGMKNPRVLWAGLGGETMALIDFQKRLECCLATLGIKKEKRSFKAHLTIGRMKHKVQPARLSAAIQKSMTFAPLSFRAEHLVFFRSELKPSGAVYTRLYTKDLEWSYDIR